MSIEHLRYPIGQHVEEEFTQERKEAAINTISGFSKDMRSICSTLSKDELDTPYRPGGWTKRQVVHHCADSHMNAFMRFKLALTEETPTIKAYDENAWAQLADSNIEIEVSLKLLDALHARWAVVLENMSDEDYNRSYFHPERNAESTLGENLLHYEWHCKHHLSHLKL